MPSSDIPSAPDLPASVSELKNKTANVTSELAESARAAAADAASTVADSVKSGKNTGAEAIARLARAVKDHAGNLEESSPEAARLMRTSAEAVERASVNLRDQDLRELVDAIGNFAARRPLAFVGCGVLAGLVLGRLFSTPDRS